MIFFYLLHTCSYKTLVALEIERFKVFSSKFYA